MLRISALAHLRYRRCPPNHTVTVMLAYILEQSPTKAWANDIATASMVPLFHSHSRAVGGYASEIDLPYLDHSACLMRLCI